MPHGAHISVSPVRLAENVAHRSGSKKEKTVASSYCLRLGSIFSPLLARKLPYRSCHIIDDTLEDEWLGLGQAIRPSPNFKDQLFNGCGKTKGLRFNVIERHLFVGSTDILWAGEKLWKR